MACAQTLPTLETVHSALNEAARSMNVDNRFGLVECGKQVQATCRIDGRSVSAIVIGPHQGSVAKSITMIFVSDGDRSKAFDAMASFGVLIRAASPQLTAEERGDVIMSLIPAVEERGARETEVGDLTYRMTMSDVIGLWFTVESSN